MTIRSTPPGPDFLPLLIPLGLVFVTGVFVGIATPIAGFFIWSIGSLASLGIGMPLIKREHARLGVPEPPQLPEARVIERHDPQ